MSETRGRSATKAEPTTLAEAFAAGAYVKGRKFGNKPVDAEGYHFDSLVEYRRYTVLKTLERCGQIVDLQVHPPFEVMRGFRDADGHWIDPITYEADFSYREPPFESGQRVVVEDVKGGKGNWSTRTKVFEIKAKLFKRKFGATHELRVVMSGRETKGRR